MELNKFLCLMFACIQHVGLTYAIYTKGGVEIPCPDSTAGLYIKTRTGQIVKVCILSFDIYII